jgi:hypothetical protein
MAEKFEQRVTFTPAYDRRHADPNQNYGIHGVECRFELIGAQGATQFVIYTNWHLPEVTKELDRRPVSREFPHYGCHPLPADLGYHRATPAYEGQASLTEECEFVGGHPCYYDGSGLQAQDLFDTFTREGDAAVWRELERFYRANVLDEPEPVPAHGAGGEGEAGQ